jgi:hypothetical protein
MSLAPSAFSKTPVPMPITVLPTVARLATQDGEPVARRRPGRTTNAASGRTREYLPRPRSIAWPGSAAAIARAMRSPS